MVPVLEMGAYADGTAALQFLLQIDSGPCGHRAYVAISVTESRPELHALTSIAHPKRPLIMGRQAWQLLLSGAGQHRVVEWGCGDHGSDVQTELVLSAINGQIDVKRLEYRCEDNDRRGVLISETDQ